MKSWNDVSPTWRKILKFVSFVILAAGAAILFSRCNPERALQRKEDKALGVVQGSLRVFPKAGAAWLDIHPCLTPIIKDSTVTKHDTITTEKKVFIPFVTTKYKAVLVDTIIDGISVYADSIGITVKNLNKKEVTTNTVYQTKVDQTRVNNLTDSLNSVYQQFQFKQGQLQQLNDVSNEKGKKIDKLWFWIIAISVASVLSHVLRSYLGGWLSSFTGMFKSKQ